MITGNYYKYKNVEVFITFKSFSPSLFYFTFLSPCFISQLHKWKVKLICNMLLSACLIAFTLLAVVYENVSLEELFFFTLSLSTNEATLDWERFNQMELENQTKPHGYYNERAIYTLLNTLFPTKWMKCWLNLIITDESTTYKKRRQQVCVIYLISLFPNSYVWWLCDNFTLNGNHHSTYNVPSHFTTTCTKLLKTWGNWSERRFGHFCDDDGGHQCNESSQF